MSLETKVDLILSELKNICVQIDEKFEKIDEKFERIDEKFERIDEKFERIDEKFEQIDQKFEQIDQKFEQIDQKFEQIDKKFEQIDEKFDKIDARFDEMDKKLDDMDKNISNLRADNLYEHEKIYNMLSSLNSAFLRFEAEQTDKINYLLDADKERKEHQIIYAHEFTRLNDLVAKNSFRISNLEQHQ